MRWRRLLQGIGKYWRPVVAKMIGGGVEVSGPSQPPVRPCQQ